MRRKASKTDAPTLGFVDTVKRRRASPSQTQREADVQRAAARGEWTPTEKDRSTVPSQSGPRDTTGIDPKGVIDESMTYLPRA